jgi:hypothetical protein
MSPYSPLTVVFRVSPKQTEALEKRQVVTLHFILTIRRRAVVGERARAVTAKGKGKQSPPMSAGIAVTWATGLKNVLNVKGIKRRRQVAHNLPTLLSVISVILALVKSAEYM